MEIEELRSLPVRYSTWDGCRVEEGPIITDGKVAFLRRHADGERAQKLIEEDPPARYRLYSTEQVKQVWTDEVTREGRRPVSIDGVRLFYRRKQQSYNTAVAKLSDGNGMTLYMNAQYLRILQLVTGFDEMEACDPKRSVALLKDGEVVAVAMPLEEESGRKWYNHEESEAV